MKKFFNFLIAFYPILSGYGLSPQADFGVILIFIVGICCIIANKKPFSFHTPEGYSLFFITAFLMSLTFAHTIQLRLLLYTVNLCLACNYLDFGQLKRSYYILVFITCSFFVFQNIVYLTTGLHISGIIPFIPTIYDGMGINQALVDSQGERFSSFFLEPSYFAQYLFPYIVFEQFSKQKNSMRNAVLVSLVVLLIRSGNGMILLMLSWGIWFLAGNYKLRVKVAYVFVGMVMITVLWKLNSVMFEGLLSRATEFQSYGGDEQYQSSGFIRMFRGYFAYADMPTINKLFGAHPDFVQAIFNNNIYFASSNDNSINGTSTILLYNGAVVCFLFFLHLFLMYWACKRKVMFVMMICCIWLMLSESYYLCARMFTTIILMYGLGCELKKSNCKQESKQILQKATI